MDHSTPVYWLLFGLFALEKVSSCQYAVYAINSGHGSHDLTVPYGSTATQYPATRPCDIVLLKRNISSYNTR